MNRIFSKQSKYTLIKNDKLYYKHPVCARGRICFIVGRSGNTSLYMPGVSHLCLTVLVIARQFKAMHWGLILLITASFLTTAAGEESRPNIIWIYAEDTSP